MNERNHGICDIHVYNRLRNCVVNSNIGLSPIDTVVILYRLYSIFIIPYILYKTDIIIRILQLVYCKIYIWM